MGHGLRFSTQNFHAIFLWTQTPTSPWSYIPASTNCCCTALHCTGSEGQTPFPFAAPTAFAARAGAGPKVALATCEGGRWWSQDCLEGWGMCGYGMPLTMGWMGESSSEFTHLIVLNLWSKKSTFSQSFLHAMSSSPVVMETSCE